MFLQLFWDCHSILPNGYGCGILRHSLPRAGGILDQDNLTMDAFQIIQAEALAGLNEKPTEKPTKKNGQ